MNGAVIMNSMKTTTNTVEIQEVLTTTGRTRWIVKVNGKPVSNYGTRRGADRKVASLAATATR